MIQRKFHSNFEFLIEIIDILISHDRRLLQYAYRAAIVASRLGKSNNFFCFFFFQKRQTIVCLGYDKCLEVLLNYGLNPNISDQTNTTPLHVAYVVDNVLSFGLSIR